MKLTTTLLAFVLTLATGHADHHEGKEHPFDLSGAWDAEAESENETREFRFTFEKKDDQWSGKSEDEDGNERAIDRVMVEGSKVTLETDMEANGEIGLIRITAEASESGEQLKGKWAVIDSNHTERISGDLSAEKIYQLDLAGVWESVATIGEEEHSSETTFEKEDGKWTGGFRNDESEGTFSKVTTEGKKLTCEFVLPVEDEEQDFQITAVATSDDLLEGEWVMLDASNQESYSGEWTAKRKRSFNLEGTWDVTSEVNGQSMESTYTIDKQENGFTGTVSNEAGSLDLRSVNLDGEKVTIVFAFGETDVTIKAEAKDDKLSGNWSATGSDGTDYSGKWAAERNEP